MALSKERLRLPTETVGTHRALLRFAGRTAFAMEAMTAERVFQVTILGLFIFSAVLANMLILNP
jgi:hypothetical protein